jgi:D-arabinose 1-dehydrogenase-like Zn-dependent alcohol dehydrogenase
MAGKKHPVVAGHELLGRVTAPGNPATKFKVRRSTELTNRL